MDNSPVPKKSEQEIAMHVIEQMDSLSNEARKQHQYLAEEMTSKDEAESQRLFETLMEIIAEIDP